MKISVLTFATAFLISSSSSVIQAQSLLFGEIEPRTKLQKKTDSKLASNDVEGALQILDRAIENKEDLYEAYKERSFIRNWHKADRDGAISDLDKAIEIKPDDPRLFISRAFIKKRYKNDIAGALSDYEAARKLQPNSTLLLKFTAELKIHLKNYGEALTDLDAAILITQDDFELHTQKANLFSVQKQPDKAISYLQAYLDGFSKKRNGKLPRVRGERVKKQIPSELKVPAGAPDYPVRRYSQMSFNSPEAYKKQMAEIETARGLAKAYIYLGRMLTSVNETEKALVALGTALEIDRNQEEAYGLRGVIYLSKGESAKAILEFNEAIDIADEPYYYLNRGVCLLLINDHKKAQKDFDTFLKLYPDGKSMLDLRIVDAKKSKISAPSN